MPSTYDLSVLKRHAFLVSFGDTVLGPLASEPKIESKIETYDCSVYEQGQDVVASYLEKNEAQVTVTTKNVAAALDLVKTFRKGGDLLASAARKALTFSPIVGSGVTEKTLTFTSAALMPELSYAPTSTADHTAKLVFRCFPDASTGALYTYA